MDMGIIKKILGIEELTKRFVAIHDYFGQVNQWIHHLNSMGDDHSKKINSLSRKNMELIAIMQKMLEDIEELKKEKDETHHSQKIKDSESSEKHLRQTERTYSSEPKQLMAERKRTYRTEEEQDNAENKESGTVQRETVNTNEPERILIRRSLPKSDALLVQILHNNAAFDRGTSLTTKEIYDNIPYKISERGLRKKLMSLESIGLVTSKKEGNTRSWYISVGNIGKVKKAIKEEE